DFVAGVQQRGPDRGIGIAVGLGQLDVGRRLVDPGLRGLQIRTSGKGELLELRQVPFESGRSKLSLHVELIGKSGRTEKRSQRRLGGLESEQRVFEVGLELERLELDLQKVRS